MHLASVFLVLPYCVPRVAGIFSEGREELGWGPGALPSARAASLSSASRRDLELSTGGCFENEFSSISF